MEINNDSTEKKILVSNEFFEIYKSFNICSQVEKIIKLSRRELYLLLTVCIDNHDDSLLSVRHNSNYFRDEILEILEIQDDKEVTNDILLSLIKETGDKYIDTDKIEDVNGSKLPEILTKDEIRDLRIDLKNDNN